MLVAIILLTCLSLYLIRRLLHVRYIINEKNVQVEQLSSKIADQESLLKEQGVQILNLTNLQHKVSIEKDQIKKESVNLKKQLSDLNKDMCDLNNELTICKQLRVGLENQVASMNTKETSLLEEKERNISVVKSLVAQVDKFRDIILKHEATIKKLEGENIKLSKMTSLEKTAQDEAKIGTLESKINTLESLLEKSQKELKEKDKIIRSVQKEKKNLEKEYDHPIKSQTSPKRLTYNDINAHKRDEDISFRESDHKYFVGERELKSVTTLVEEYFPPFDVERFAKIMARKNGGTAQDYIRQWEAKGEESRNLGTVMHANIEKYYLGETFEVGDVFEQFLAFANATILNPYRTEWKIYDEESGIAGTLDFLDYQNGEYTIYDWKRSKKVVSKTGIPILKSKYNTKGFAPLQEVEDASYWHYALQTSLYRYILHKCYDIEVTCSKLVVMHPEIKMAFVVEVPYMKNEIEALLH